MKNFFARTTENKVRSAAGLIMKRLAGNDLSADMCVEILTILNEEIIRCCGITLYNYNAEGELSLFSSTYEDAEWISAQRTALDDVKRSVFEHGSKGKIGELLKNSYISSKREPEVLCLEMGAYEYGYLVCDCEIGEGAKVKARLDRFTEEGTDESIVYSAICVMVRHRQVVKKTYGDEEIALSRKELIMRLKKLGASSIIVVGTCSDAGLTPQGIKDMRNRYAADLRSVLPYGHELYVFDDVVACILEKSGAGPAVKDKCIANLNALYAGKRYRPFIIECDVSRGQELMALYACENKMEEAVPGKLYSLYYRPEINGYGEVVNVDFGEPVQEAGDIAEDDAPEVIDGGEPDYFSSDVSEDEEPVYHDIPPQEYVDSGEGGYIGEVPPEEPHDDNDATKDNGTEADGEKAEEKPAAKRRRTIRKAKNEEDDADAKNLC